MSLRLHIRGLECFGVEVLDLFREGSPCIRGSFAGLAYWA